ncbi:MAG: hypothetical protein AMK72_08715 [Planctomycetes bacterium SM23_25]|nr:MAG: hypothetical protein AMK72_08715 [Planctomycetes bacterium SM23_25]
MPTRPLLIVLAILGAVSNPPSALGRAIIVDRHDTDLTALSEAALTRAKADLHIAYGHTSHGSQVTTGMAGLVGFVNARGLGLAYPTDFFEWNNGGTGGALDLHDYFKEGDLGNPDRTTWATRTRDYLDSPANSDVNVVMWSWCGQADTTAANIDLYLGLMTQLEIDYPDVHFVYMTGHVNGCSTTGNLFLRNQQIRDYCLANGKILYDFADIESWDPDGNYYGDKLVTDDCSYDSDGNGTRDRNWAIDWQSSHVEGVDWYDCSSAHSQPLNANRKAYAAWSLWAEIAAETDLARWQAGADDHWENPANWSGGEVPDHDATATFDEPAPRQPMLYGNQSADGVDFRTPGWTVGGGFRLTVGAGGIDSAGAGANTVEAAVAMSENADWTVAADNTLTLAGPADLGGHTLTKKGDGTLTISGSQDHATGSVLAGEAGTVVLNSDAGSDGIPDLTVEVSGGAVHFGATQHLASLRVDSGTCRLAGDGSRTVVAGELLVGLPASVLDLADNNLVVDYTGGASPFGEIVSWVASGFRDGPTGYWDGPGIRSSEAAGHIQSLTALGIIDNSDPNFKIGGLTDLEGEPVSAESVLTAYTWWGDANLDGVVDSNDYDMIDNAWLLWVQEGRVAEGGFRWAVGDFNYDNTLDSNDYDLIDRAWLLSAGAPHGGGAPTPTPEPATLLLLAAAGMLVLGRRPRVT